MNQLINFTELGADVGEPTEVPIEKDNQMKSVYSIYLSGKITGDPKYLEKFAIVAHELRITYPQATVFNPAYEFSEIANELYKSGADEETQHRILVKMCLKMLKEYEAIALMPDWVESRGAAAELNAALERGMTIVRLTEEWMPKDDEAGN